MCYKSCDQVITTVELVKSKPILYKVIDIICSIRDKYYKQEVIQNGNLLFDTENFQVFLKVCRRGHFVETQNVV